MNSYVDAYLLVGRFIDAKVLEAMDQTRLAALDYQQLGFNSLIYRLVLPSYLVLFFIDIDRILVDWSESGNGDCGTAGIGHSGG